MHKFAGFGNRLQAVLTISIVLKVINIDLLTTGISYYILAAYNVG